MVDRQSSMRNFAITGLPLAVGVMIACAALALPPHEQIWKELVLAGALAGLLVAAIWRPGSTSAPHRAWPAWAYLLTVALLRDVEGGAGSGYAPLLFIPIIWLALFCSLRQLVVGLGLMVAALAMPIFLVGGEAYPSSEWWRSTIYALVAPLMAITTLWLVARLRASERNLSTVAAAVRAIPDTANARLGICRATCQVVDACTVLLWEPDGAGHLVLTAQVGTELPIGTTLKIGSEPSGAATALTSRRELFLPDVRSNAVASRRVARASRTVSMFFSPIMRAQLAVGVLAVGWSKPVARPNNEAISMTRLLAAEAGIVIERADLLRDLSDLARTDELTGLANRRAWDEELPRELSRAERSRYPLCVALFDLDDFKHLNDTQGHLEGDRLLKELGAVWSAELRKGDRLARIGGDEFAAVFPGCSLERARAIVERMCAAIPGARTCSVGVVMWDGVESTEALVGRADVELYGDKRRVRSSAASLNASASDYY